MRDHRRPVRFLPFLIVSTLVASVAPQVSAYDQIAPVLIEKNQRGRLSGESVVRFQEALNEIREHGRLRAWVVANASEEQLEPTDPRYERLMRRIRGPQERIVANLTRAMGEVEPAEVYPSVGPYLAVTLTEAGAEALVQDRNVKAFAVLVPVYR